MSNVFKRPMFRKGGEVGGGITSGMRNLYAEGDEKPSERIKAELDKYSAPAIDPINQLLIEGGLRGMKTAGQGGLFANLAAAFEQPTQNLFKNLSAQRKEKRDIALEGVIADIGKEESDEANRIKKEIAELKNERIAAEGNLDRQNKIDLQIKKGEQALAELQFKLDNPEANITKEQVIPNFENVVDRRTETYMQSKNPAVKGNPGETAFNITKFRREASPEILAKYKGFRPYDFDNKGNIIPLPLDRYQPGDIIYDAVDKEFLIFDNAGGTYILNKLTFEIQEGK
tara:strand:- start:3474 stop:4331 length:858 start_codon:yes stop_codon:yes gene_type:complete